MREDSFINFTGITHDHATLYPSSNSTGAAADSPDDGCCSTIAILRRHPMYDSLILVKKFRNCLAGYSLEFPADKLQPNEDEPLPVVQNAQCGRQRLVSRFLDADDPMYQSMSIVGGAEVSIGQESPTGSSECLSSHPFVPQIDDRGDHCELVHVPINGLMDRLKNYTDSGVAVDSRVYAFAMGLKTAERILTTNCMKELQETPI